MKNKKFRLIIGAALILVLGGIITLTLVTCKNCSRTEYVTISFETGEGSNVSPIQVEKGSTAPEISTPTMIGATFENWYYDNSLSNPFSYDDVINEDITLYANYELDINNLNIQDSTEHYEDDCDKIKEVTVIAKKGLSKDQFLKNVNIEAVSGDLPNFDVAISGDEYTIIPLNVEGREEAGYEAGKIYKITLPNSYRFKDFKQSVKEYTFRIHKDEVEYAAVNENIKYLLTDELFSYSTKEKDEYVFIVPALVFNKHDLKVNDIVSISNEYKLDENNEKTLDTDNATVVKITGFTKLDNGDYFMVDAVQASLGEMFSDVNYYGSSTIPVDDIIATISEADMEKELQNSEGVKKMSRLLARSIGNSESVKKALRDDEDFTSNTHLIEDTIKQISIKFQDVKITVKLGKGHNPNFDGSLDDDFCVLQFRFEYEATIKKKIKIKAEFELTQYIAVTMQGDSDFSLKNLYLRFDYAFNVYSQTDIDLTVLICSIDEDDEEYRDISDEIANKLSSGEESDDNSNLITELQDMLDNDSGDIEIMKVPIIVTKVPVIPIIHVFDVNTNLSFVIKVNFGAGINIDASVLEAVQIGAKGDTDSGNISSYKHQLPGGDQYSLELSACGYLGVKLGFETSLTISFCGASKFGEVGLAVFVGPYVDLYGYVKMSLSRVGYVPSQYGQKKVTSTVIGGYYIEIGINVQVELIARSDFFKVKAGVDLLNYKIPIVTFGSKDVLYDIVEQEEEEVVLMNDSTNADTFSIDYRNFIYAKGEFLDITTGKTNTKDISHEKLHMTFDNRCFSYDNLKGVIIYDRTKNNGALTDECTVTMYYTDSYLMFSSNSSSFYKCPAGTVKLIWTDTNKIPAESAGKTYNATIQFIIDGELVEERVQPIRAGKKLGYIPNPYNNSYYSNKSWNLDSFTEVITDDITFTFTAEARLVYVSFMYFDVEKSKWKIEIRAVKLGETPVAPEIQTESEKVHFNYWKASTGNVARNQSISPNGLSPVIDGDYFYKYGYIEDQFVTGYKSNDIVLEWEGEDYYEVYYRLMNERLESGSQYYFLLTHIYEADYLFNDCTLSAVFPDDINETRNHNYSITVPFNATYLQYQLNYIMPSDRTFIGFSLNEDLSNPFSLNQMPRITKDTTIYYVYGYKDYDVKIYYYDDIKDEYIIYDEDYTYSGIDDLNNLRTKIDDLLVKEPGVTYESCGWINKFNNQYNKLTEVTGDLELYPNYIRTYDITFDPDGGELYSSSIEGNKITTSSRIFNGKNSTLLEIKAYKEDEKYDYEFLGWADEDGNIYDAYFSYEFTGPTSLKAVWGNPTEKTYKVEVVSSHDILLNGKNIDHFEGNYDEYLEFINKYHNYTPSTIIANGYKTTFTLREETINGYDYVNYLNFESINSRLQYIVTINANGGKLTADCIEEIVGSEIGINTIEHLRDYVDESGNNIYEFKYYYGRYVYLSKLVGEKEETLKARYSVNNYSVGSDTYTKFDDITVTSDITIIINWNEELIDYTVTYYVDDEEIHTDTYHYEDDINVLERPTDTMKYKWSGWTWYIGDEALDVVPTKMLNYNYKVKATTEEVKLTYIVDGKTIKEEVVDANSIITLIAKEEKEGYEVTDWASEGITVENNTFIMPEHDVTFTSTFKKKTFKVTYLDVSGEEYDTCEYLFGETVSVIDLPKDEGKYYTWVSDDVTIIGSSFTIPSKDITIKLKEFTKQYRLSYVVNNIILKYEYVTPLVTKELDPTLFDDRFEGYTFSGWYSKEVEIKDNTFTTIDSDIYLYGYYTTGDIQINVYLDDTDEVSLVLYGNSGSVINGYNVYTVNNSSITDDGIMNSSNEILIKLYNYNIGGWYMNDGVEFYPSIRLEDDMDEVNIKPYYMKLYKVSYDLNDLGNYNEDIEEIYISDYYDVGTKVYLLDLPTLQDYRVNYCVLDWFTIADVELHTDDGGTYFYMPEYDVTFNTTEYYKIESEDTYKATIYLKLPNGEEVLYCEYMVDSETQFSAVTPKIDGYYIVCLKDEEGNEYEDKAYINSEIMEGQDKKFIAIYEEITKQMLTLRINGEVIMGMEYDSYLGGYIRIPYISVEGYKLLGWYDEYGVLEYMDDGEGNYFDISLYIEKDLLGEDLIFDAILIPELSSFSLNISFGALDESFEILHTESNDEGELVFNIVEDTSFELNNQYFDNYYDIELYVSVDNENYKNITDDYLISENDLVLVSIPSIEDILTLFEISEYETIVITINYVLQTNAQV